MRIFTVSEATASLGEVIERVLAGEQVAIGCDGHAEVLLVPVERSAEPRPLGGLDVPDYWMRDDFDEPLAGFADEFAPP